MTVVKWYQFCCMKQPRKIDLKKEMTKNTCILRRQIMKYLERTGDENVDRRVRENVKQGNRNEKAQIIKFLGEKGGGSKN